MTLLGKGPALCLAFAQSFLALGLPSSGTLRLLLHSWLSLYREGLPASTHLSSNRSLSPDVSEFMWESMFLQPIKETFKVMPSPAAFGVHCAHCTQAVGQVD